MPRTIAVSGRSQVPPARSQASSRRSIAIRASPPRLATARLGRLALLRGPAASVRK